MTTSATTTVIPLDYSSTTLERIMHYCYTDQVREPLDDGSEEKVRDMVRLRCAALDLELPFHELAISIHTPMCMQKDGLVLS
jgi:hypothetical protein